MAFFGGLARRHSDDNYATELREIRRVIDGFLARIRVEHAKGYYKIAPALCEAGFGTFVKYVGVMRAKHFYEKILCEIDKSSRIPASVIIDVKPDLDQLEIEWLGRTFQPIIEALSNAGFNTCDIAKVFTAHGYDLAAEHVDRLYGAFLIRKMLVKTESYLAS